MPLRTPRELAHLDSQLPVLLFLERSLDRVSPLATLGYKLRGGGVRQAARVGEGREGWVVDGGWAVQPRARTLGARLSACKITRLSRMVSAKSSGLWYTLLLNVGSAPRSICARWWTHARTARWEMCRLGRAVPQHLHPGAAVSPGTGSF